MIHRLNVILIKITMSFPFELKIDSEICFLSAESFEKSRYCSRTRLGERKAFALPNVKTDYKSLEQNHPEGRLTFKMEVEGPKMHTCKEIWCMS